MSGAGTDPPDTFRLGVRPALDGLRGVAVLLVVGFHARIPLFAGGSLGVQVFFVLSGFLITTLLLEEWCTRGSIGLRPFYARRALRLVPALALVLLVCVVAGEVLAAAARRSLDAEVLAAGTYVTNWVIAAKPSFPADSYLGHTWSLAVEAQFYFVWPFILLGALRMGWTRRRILVVVVGLALASVAWQAILVHEGFTTHAAYGLDTNASSLLLGVALALVLVRRQVGGWAQHAAVPVAAGAAVAWLAVACIWGEALPLPVALQRGAVGVASAVLIGCILVAPEGLASRALHLRALVAVGVVSYGVYLWHYVVFAVISSDHLAWPAPVLLAVKLGITAVITVASYRFVERPFLRRRGRFIRRNERKGVSGAMPAEPALS